MERDWDDYDDYGDFDYDYDHYEDPPLYPAGKIEAMTAEELEREIERQCDIQGALGDAEYINDAAVERAEARYQICVNALNDMLAQHGAL